jgi:hypothetical protein
MLDEDRQMLEELLGGPEYDDEETRFNPRPFREMLERGYPLTARQRAWLRDVHERIVGTPHYSDNSKVPRGREVQSMVGALPLRPPQRRTT